MILKKILIIISILFLISACQAIKEKSDKVAERENEKFGQFLGKKENDLKIELGTPSEDFLNEKGNKVLVYKNKKYGITCERKFELDTKNIIVSFSSSGCI